MSKMFDEGYKAFFDGVKQDDCPYCCDDAEEWLDGWMIGKSESGCSFSIDPNKNDGEQNRLLAILMDKINEKGGKEDENEEK